MAGYTGQLIALDVNTPTETELAGAQASAAQTQANVAKAIAPATIAATQAEAADKVLTTQQAIQLNAFRQHLLQKQQAQRAQMASPLAAAQSSYAGQPDGSGLFDPRVEQVMQSIDPDAPDAASQWDAEMSQLAQAGVPQAQQFVGNLSKSNLMGWRAQIGAHSVASALSPLAMSAPSAPGGAISQLGAGARAAASGLASGASPLAATSGGTPVASQQQSNPAISPITGAEDPDLAGMAILDPAGTQKFIQMQGMMMYQQTGNPEYLKRYAPETYEQLTTAQKNLTGAQKEALATRAAMMGQAANSVLALASKLGPDAPEVKRAYQEGIIAAAKQGWISPQDAQMRLRSPVDFGWLSQAAVSSETVAEWAKSSGQEAINEARAKQAYPTPDYQYIGTTSAGTPLYHDIHGAPGTPDITGNIPVNAKPSAGAETFNVKKQAWLDVHPGDEDGALRFAQGQHQMTPGQINIAAQNAAIRAQTAASLSNPGAPFDTQAAYNQYVQEFSSGAAGGNAAGGAGTPQTAGLTPAQKQTSQRYVGVQKAKPGTIRNPVVPTSAAQFKALAVGTYYIDADGQVYQKHKQ